MISLPKNTIFLNKKWKAKSFNLPFHSNYLAVLFDTDFFNSNFIIQLQTNEVNT